MFIVQFETSECISAALEIFKSWRPNFNPRYWMIDYSQAEMNAINATFPGGKIALCDFHREQAWDRWPRKKETGTDRDQALFYLRQLARAHSVEEFNAAVTQMKCSDLWATSPAFQSYVEGHWLPVSAMWAACFRPGLSVTTNGTEAQNKMPKERCLKSHSGRRTCSTGLMQTLQTFLSDREQHLHRENLKVSTDYRLHHDAVPLYLHNRPRSVVLHITSRLAEAGDIEEKSVTPGHFPCQKR